MYVVLMSLSTPDFHQSVGVGLLAFKLSMADKNAHRIGVTSIFHVRVHTTDRAANGVLNISPENIGGSDPKRSDILVCSPLVDNAGDHFTFVLPLAYW